MGKKIRFSIGAVAGAFLQYLYDPQEGEVRRALLRDQMADRVDEAKTALARRIIGRTRTFFAPVGSGFQRRHRLQQHLGLHGLIS